MKIIRQELQGQKPTRTVVSRYTGITTTTAHDFLVAAAQRESNKRPDVDVVSVGGILSGRSTVTLIDKSAKPLVRFEQEW